MTGSSAFTGDDASFPISLRDGAPALTVDGQTRVIDVVTARGVRNDFKSLTASAVP